MIDTGNPEDVEQLQIEIASSFDELEHVREDRQQELLDFVGPHYVDPSEYGKQQACPVDYRRLAVDVYLRKLVAQVPAALCTTYDRSLRPVCEAFEKAIDKRVQRMKLGDELEICIFDALFRVGILKVYQEFLGTTNRGGQDYKMRRTRAEAIDFDDWFHDTTARRPRELRFEGNLIRMEEDDFQDSAFFPNEMKEAIRPDDLSHYEVGHRRKVEEMGTGKRRGDAEASAFVEITETWLPRTKQMLYMPWHWSSKKIPRPTKIVKWKGWHDGPYIKLGFGIVPNNILPMAPVTDILSDMNDLAQELWVKLDDQCRRQKTIPIVKSGSEPDAEKLKGASDGEWQTLDDMDSFAEARMGGGDQANLMMFLQTTRLIDQHGGNLSALGGFGPQSDTARQDEQLGRTASEKIRALQERTIEFTRKAFNAVAWYEWRDRLADPKIGREMRGGLIAPLSFAPERRKGDFDEYDIGVQPYSMQDRSPAMRLAELDRSWRDIIMPMAQQMWMFERRIPDIGSYLEHRARLSAIPELTDLTMFFGPDTSAVAGGGGAGGGSEASRPSVTHRTNERISRPGATPRGQDDVMMQIAGGGNPQEAEAKSLFRNIGE